MAIDRTLSASMQRGATTATSSSTVTSVEQQYFATFANTSLTISDKADLLDRIANHTYWTKQIVTYSFPTELSADYASYPFEGTTAAFSENQIAAVHEVIALFEDIMNIDFQFAGTDINADTRFYNTTLVGTAVGYYAAPKVGGDIWIYNFATYPPEARDYTIASYDYHLLVHELGHTLGFSHTGDFTGTTYLEQASYVQDNNAYSAMSYLLPSAAGIDWNHSYDAMPMIQDILGLQHYYGANMTTRSGDTVYGFNSNITDRAPLNFDTMAANGEKIAAIAIWDAGGNDTVDLSGFTQDAHLDLNEAAFSNAGGKEMLVSIAYGVTVESGITGEGNDVLVGNVVANKLQGGDGSDILFGGAGNDTLTGDGMATIRQFDSSFDLVEINPDVTTGQKVSLQNASFGGQSFTIEFLWKQGLLQNESYSFSLPGLSIYRYNNGTLGIMFWSATEKNWNYMGSSQLGENALHRITLSYDDATGKLGFYVDGLIKYQNSYTPGTRGIPAAGNITFSDHGLVGDVRVYNRALTATEIKDHAWVTLKDTSTATGLIYNLQANDSGGLTDTVTSVATVQTGTPQSVIGAEGFHINRNDHLYGEDGNDTLDGGLGNNELHGGAGEDAFISHAGSDLLDGGDGIDTADYSASLAGVSINLAAGTASGGDADSDELIAIENVTGSATAANSLIGSDANNVLRGGSGNDTLNGGLGSDQLAGGAGNDTYFTDGSDIITEVETAGFDKVYSSASLALAANLESLILTGTAIRGIGNAMANTIVGNVSANKLYGGLGNDKIAGGNGTDIMTGGIGVDQLSGGKHADIFDFNSIKESQKNFGVDYITDFYHGTDHIDLRTIDASSRQTGNNAFTFIGTSTFHKQAGELRYVQSNKAGTANDNTFITADINGDGTADFSLKLKGLKTLATSDFFL